MAKATPPVVDRSVWMAQVAQLRVREKTHTREGEARDATDGVFCAGPFA